METWTKRQDVAMAIQRKLECVNYKDPVNISAWYTTLLQMCHGHVQALCNTIGSDNTYRHMRLAEFSNVFISDQG
jgi:hypothetical protein